MYVIEVIPLTNLPPQVPQLLSYFFNRQLVKGSIVEVLIGNRKIPAAVVSSASLEERKISLKKSGFQLKKVSGVISEASLISDTQFKLALWLAKNYFAPLGACLKTVLPAFFLKKGYVLDIDKADVALDGKIQKPIFLLSEAGGFIKNIEPEIKRMLGLKRQILVIVPEIYVAEYLYEILAGYHEVALIHSKIPLKKLYKDWNRILSGEAEVIIGTRQAMFSPFHNLGLIIVEDPANESYKSDMSPKYNATDLALKLSNIYSCAVMFVARLPDLKRHLLSKSGMWDVEGRPNLSRPDITITDMIQEMKSGNFALFGRNLRKQITEYIDKKKKILIFSSRKGYTGSLLCENCGFVFKCPNCSIPMRLHKKPDAILICNRCSTSQNPTESCPNCHSHKLKMAGYSGSERLEEELKQFVSVPIFIFDSSSVKTAKAEKDMIDKIESSEPCLCIATKSIFSYRYARKFDLVGIPNIDSLTAIPDFKAEEALFYQFEKILDFEPEKVIVQSYNADSAMLRSLVKGNYAEFYEKEMMSRKLFWYPPFARLIKLSFRHNNQGQAGYEARVLSEKLKMAIVQRKLDQSVKILGPSPAFVEKEKGYYVYNIILKILPEQRPEEILNFVPSHWTIDIDPKSIL